MPSTIVWLMKVCVRCLHPEAPRRGLTLIGASPLRGVTQAAQRPACLRYARTRVGAVLRLCCEDDAVVLARRSVLGRRSKLADSDTADGIRRRNCPPCYLVITVSAGENHLVAMLGL